LVKNTNGKQENGDTPLNISLDFFHF